MSHLLMIQYYYYVFFMVMTLVMVRDRDDNNTQYTAKREIVRGCFEIFSTQFLRYYELYFSNTL